MDHQCLHRWVCAFNSPRKPKAPRSAFCHRITFTAQPHFQPAAEKLWHRSWDVLSREPRILFVIRHRKNCNPAQRERAVTCQQKGPKRAIGPPSRDRTPYCSPQSAGTWKKSNENRSWGFDLRLPICTVLQFNPFDARSHPPPGSCYVVSMKNLRSKIKKRNTPFQRNLC